VFAPIVTGSCSPGIVSNKRDAIVSDRIYITRLRTPAGTPCSSGATRFDYMVGLVATARVAAISTPISVNIRIQSGGLLMGGTKSAGCSSSRLFAKSAIVRWQQQQQQRVCTAYPLDGSRAIF
jgi:hypothetical protein